MLRTTRRFRITSALLAAATATVGGLQSVAQANGLGYVVRADTTTLNGYAFSIGFQLSRGTNAAGATAGNNTADIYGFTPYTSVNETSPVSDGATGSLRGGLHLDDGGAGDGSASYKVSGTLGTSLALSVRVAGDQLEGRAGVADYAGLGISITGGAFVLNTPAPFHSAAELYVDHTGVLQTGGAAIVTILPVTPGGAADHASTFSPGGVANFSAKAGWSNGVPDLLTDATVATGSAGFDTNATVHNLTVNAGASVGSRAAIFGLTLAGSSMTINGTLMPGTTMRFLNDATISGIGTSGTNQALVAEGALTIAAGHTFTLANSTAGVTGTFNVANGLTVNGKLSITGTGSAITAGSIANVGTLSFTTAPGTNGFAGTRTLAATSIVNDGTLSNLDGNLNVVATSLTNNGTLSTGNDFLYLRTPTIVNNGVIRSDNGPAAKISLNPDDAPNFTVTGSGSWEDNYTLELTGRVNVQTTGPLTLGPGALMISNAVSTFSCSNLSGGSSTTLSASKALTLNILNGDPTKPFAGTMNGTFNIVKSGPGTQVITSSNNVSGSTLITGGTILVNNDATNGSGYALPLDGGVTISGTGTLAGTGSVVRVYIQNGGTISPGDPNVNDGIATLDVFSTQFSPGSTLKIDIRNDTRGSGFDYLETDSSMMLGGTLALNNKTAQLPTYGTHYRIADVPLIPPDPSPADTVFRSGVFATITGNKLDATHWLAVTYDSSGVNVTVALPGDADLSKTVDFNDLLSLAKNYGQTSGGVWIKGDFDGNGSVNFDDLLALAKNYSASVPAGALSATVEADWQFAQALVPEPTAMTLIGCALFGTLGRRGRRIS